MLADGIRGGTPFRDCVPVPKDDQTLRDLEDRKPDSSVALAPRSDGPISKLFSRPSI